VNGVYVESLTQFFSQQLSGLIVFWTVRRTRLHDSCDQVFSTLLRATSAGWPTQYKLLLFACYWVFCVPFGYVIYLPTLKWDSFVIEFTAGFPVYKSLEPFAKSLMAHLKP